MASQLLRGLRFALTDSGVPLRSCFIGATTCSACDHVGHATHRRFSEAAASPATDPAPAKPSIDALKYQFSSKIAQVTKGDPSNALSAVPAVVDLILESIPAAVHSVAITSVSPEVLRAANTGVGAGRPGDIPRLDVVFSLDYKQLLPAMHFLSKSASLQFNTLVEMTAVDWPERANARFEVTYVLYSPTLNMRCIVKVMVDELTPLESVTPIFKNANWLERETWDMFGVFFKNHPDLRRILTDYGFSHFPLRKDFPVQGYTEVAYSEERKAVTSRPVQLAQAHRVIKD